MPWHEHWFLGLPTDYWTFCLVGVALLIWSFTGKEKARLLAEAG